MKLTDILETIPGIGTPEEAKKNFEKTRKIDVDMTAKFGKDWNVFKKNKKNRDEILKLYQELKAKY